MTIIENSKQPNFKRLNTKDTDSQNFTLLARNLLQKKRYYRSKV